MSLATRLTQPLVGTAVLVGLFLLTVPADAIAQQYTDQIEFTSDGPRPRSNRGQLVDMRAGEVQYEMPDGTERLMPWQIEYVQFGVLAQTAEFPHQPWNAALTQLRGESYSQALAEFDRIEQSQYNSLPSISGRYTREHVIYATYYYRGLANLRLAQSILRSGDGVLSEIDQVASAESPSRDQVNALREYLTREIPQIARAAGNEFYRRGGPGENVDYRGDFDDVRSELYEAIQGGGGADEIASAEFRASVDTFVSLAARPGLEEAVRLLNFMFETPPAGMEFGTIRSFFTIHMKFAVAEAYRELGMYAEALAELDSSANSFNLRYTNEEGEEVVEETAIPVRSNTEQRQNPVLVNLIREIVANPITGAGTRMNYRNPQYLIVAARAFRLYAEIAREAGGYEIAQEIYILLQDFVQGQYSSFLDVYRDQARLDSARVTAQLLGYRAGREQLLGIIASFEFESNDGDVDDDEIEGYMFDPISADKYAGAYITLGELARDQYVRANRTDEAVDYLQQALDAYLRVLAFFLARDEITSEAMYQAARCYRDIAGHWEEEYANRPPANNPYFYYLDQANKLEQDLRSNYPESEWARRIAN